jgi:hypothetical protein
MCSYLVCIKIKQKGENFWENANERGPVGVNDFDSVMRWVPGG